MFKSPNVDASGTTLRITPVPDDDATDTTPRTDGDDSEADDHPHDSDDARRSSPVAPAAATTSNNTAGSTATVPDPILHANLYQLKSTIRRNSLQRSVIPVADASSKPDASPGAPISPRHPVVDIGMEDLDDPVPPAPSRPAPLSPRDLANARVFFSSSWHDLKLLIACNLCTAKS